MINYRAGSYHWLLFRLNNFSRLSLDDWDGLRNKFIDRFDNFNFFSSFAAAPLAAARRP